MATATKKGEAKPSSTTAKGRIEKWRRLASQWLAQHKGELEHSAYDLAVPPDFSKKVSFPKGSESEARRGLLLPIVNYLYHHRLDSQAKELAAWEYLGKLVIHETMDDVDYCGDGAEGIRGAKRLLGEPVTFDFDLKLRNVVMPASFKEDAIHGLRITITNVRGVVLSERIKPMEIETEVEDY